MTLTWRAFGFASILSFAQLSIADCDHTAPKSAAIDATGARKVVIEVGAGDLIVRGTPSATQVRAKGEACAESKKLLDAIRIETSRDGETVYLKAVMPESDSWANSASLDLVIDVPAAVALALDDSSGDLELHKVAAATVRDSSGDQSIRDVEGELDINDSSGDIDIQNIRGDVSVRDSSGDVRIADISGTVTIPVDSSGNLSMQRVRGDVHILTDSSGDIVIADINQNVRIDNDSSGDIRVSAIGGNFSVANDSTGDISHKNVLGTVTIPSDD